MFWPIRSLFSFSTAETEKYLRKKLVNFIFFRKFYGTYLVGNTTHNINFGKDHVVFWRMAPETAGGFEWNKVWKIFIGWSIKVNSCVEICKSYHVKIGKPCLTSLMWLHHQWVEIFGFWSFKLWIWKSSLLLCLCV